MSIFRLLNLVELQLRSASESIQPQPRPQGAFPCEVEFSRS